MRINTNLTALNTFTQYTNNNTKISKSVKKLSSGSAINNAADNAAGLAISEKMRAQIRGLEKASTNAQDAISLIQTAEGSLSESTEILQRMRELATQAASDTNEDKIDREALQDEFSQLQKELDDIAKNTTFNKKNLLDGSLSASTKSVNIKSLANSTTAISVGNAAAGNYSFTVTTKQEAAAIQAFSAKGTASLGTTAKATINSSDVIMGNATKETALYNGNYKLSSEVDSSSGSITVKAIGDNGQTFTCILDKAQINGEPSVELNFETSKDAGDSFTLNLNLKEATNADSVNGLQTLAKAIEDVTVSVDGGIDAKDATYGVYANITGGTSVKLSAGDSSVTFDNGITVSFDKLTATDVAVNASSAKVLAPSDAIDVTFVDGSDEGEDEGTAGYIEINLATYFSSLDSGDDFAIRIGDNTYSGVYKGEQNGDLKKLIETTLSDVVATDGDGEPLGMSVSTDGAVTFTTSDIGSGATIKLNGVDIADGNENDIAFLAPSDGTALGAFNVGGLTSASTFTTAAITNTLGTGAWAGAAAGDDVYFQIGDELYSGKYIDSGASSVNDTLSSMLNGKTYTSSNGYTYAFTSATDGAATFTATRAGTAIQTADFKTSASTFAIGNQATLSDGLVSKLGTTKDTNTRSTTATTFTVNSTANAGLTFQVGANEGDEMVINIEAMNSQSLGVNSAKVSTQEAASAAIGTVDKAINQVSSQRAYLGAIQNRLDHKIANLDTSTENLTAAESQIRDVDMAKEMTNFTNANILAQAATAMLAQANSQPQGVLSLLG